MDKLGARCPFCWTLNVKRVDRPLGGTKPEPRGALMECEECEKWYWENSREEVAALFTNCQTAILRPDRCYDEAREILFSGGSRFPRRRLAEFNHLCSECPHGRFVSYRSSISRPKNLFPMQF